MGYLANKKSRELLKKLGMTDESANDIINEMSSGLDEAKKSRDVLKKLESKTYLRAIKKINNISYEPIPLKDKNERSLKLINELELSDYGRKDLIDQTHSMYKEALSSSIFDQVFAMLIRFREDNVTKVQKIDNSLKLIDISELTQEEKNDLIQQVKIEYGLN